MAGSVNDIDLQRRAEAALQQAQRLDALGTLAGGIAHDFNNILGAILGFGEMAVRDSRAGSRVRRDVEGIMTAGERGRSLVERILAFSRTGVGERVPIHLESVVREAVDMISAGMPKGLSIALALNSGRAATVGDAAQLHQVVMNLVANAMQAMTEGVVHVMLDAIRLQQPCLVTTGTVEAGEHLVLSVRDAGCGMPPEVLSRIFDPFFTTKDVGTGTGLGLSIVHGIVSELGGAIDVATAVPGGSTFTVYFPRVGEAAVAAAAEPVSLQRGRLEQVLLVDDEEPLVRLMAGTLVDLGYVPVGFLSGVDALAAFTAHPERFDAVVTDARMPGLSGVDLIRALRAVRPGVPIVMVSGYLGTGIERQAREAGADDVLRKPLVTAELASALSRALRGRASSTGPPSPAPPPPAARRG
jgi:nitrogen-specific signal transduction histidine kinase/CheY-like chemotaxis protein